MAEDAITDLTLEKAEWNAVLSSRLLTRSPSVLRMAEYIGSNYFEGRGAMLKEYNIAVEALGKPPDFDPKLDSIVRVEAHRLRRKLQEYYRTEGAGHPLKAVLEPGQYVPKFVRNPGPPVPLPEIVVVPPPQSAVSRRKRDRRRPAVVVIFVAIALALVSGSYFVRYRLAKAAPSLPSIRISSGAPGVPVVLSTTNIPWQGDRWFAGGKSVFGSLPGLAIPEIGANTQRQGDFDYAIPLPDAPYELRLYFGYRLAGPARRGPVQTRRFNVDRNGTRLIDALDPSASRRTGQWTVKVFHDVRPARDGLLHLSFRSAADPAYVSGIELTPGQPGRLTPIRLLSKSSPYQDSGGHVWLPERYVTGGLLAARSDPFAPGIDPNLLSGERFGTFGYEIPVSAGRYVLKLYFAETWFGPSLGRGGIGSRRFDVSANGTPLLQDFDILREAGQSYRGIVKVFHGLTPDLDGYINLMFTPRVNNACVNALELVDEGGGQ